MIITLSNSYAEVSNLAPSSYFFFKISRDFRKSVNFVMALPHFLNTTGYQCRLFIHKSVIFLAVRFYFIICLFGRQFIVTGTNPSGIDLWLPITTMIQFIVYMGWMKVAEALLNPLGEDDDDLECNYVIDKNLIVSIRTDKSIIDTEDCVCLQFSNIPQLFV
ncbi:hypothetical protein OESDEN_05516 [Oesophagostomum dentatum]|uniref:Bestrophin homolog n=1 Tax=Oesophagostomum dentatum TaxID=61180 RepID=A0A0B1TAH4_OESDE|nr:hypothetical protein OESDEN_05516 [Oesophagostomum dentatum]